jgi:prolyl oligopeptidase
VQYLLLSIEEGCDPVNRLYYFDLTTLLQGLEGFKGSNNQLPFKKLVDNFEAQYQLVANDKSVFTFLTNKNAPRYKLTRVDLNDPSNWTDVIPESKTDVLVSADCVNLQQLLLCYMRDVKHQLQLHDLQTGSLLRHLHLEIGSVTEISGQRQDSEIYFNFTSFLTPGIIYQCDLISMEPEVKVLWETAVANFDRALFETKQVNFCIKEASLHICSCIISMDSVFSALFCIQVIVKIFYPQQYHPRS